jgi:hypothetical protein
MKNKLSDKTLALIVIVLIGSFFGLGAALFQSFRRGTLESGLWNLILSLFNFIIVTGICLGPLLILYLICFGWRKPKNNK